jgi:sugar phosphate isomerase/epimerase
MPHELTRRSVLAAVSSLALSPAAGANKIRLGGPIFLQSDDPRELAREHKRLGYSAALCPPAQADDATRVRAIEKAFAAEDVVIAEVGAWTNMLDPDAARRRANMRYVTERLALADEVGARCCVNIAGTFAPVRAPHPDDLSQKYFDATVENCRRLLDDVKPKRTKLTIEMMAWCLPDSPDAYLKLMKAVDRQGLAVHLDPCNGINSAIRYYHNAEFIAECVQKLGPWIVSCHAKDLDMLPESNIHLMEVIPGRGKVDYRAYLGALSRLPADIPLMLEHLKTAEEYEEGAAYLRKVAREAGIALG